MNLKKLLIASVGLLGIVLLIIQQKIKSIRIVSVLPRRFKTKLVRNWRLKIYLFLKSNLIN